MDHFALQGIYEHAQVVLVGGILAAYAVSFGVVALVSWIIKPSEG